MSGPQPVTIVTHSSTSAHIDLFTSVAAAETGEKYDLNVGKEFEAMYILNEASKKFRDVIVRINSHGIVMYDPSNKKRYQAFDVDHILQFTYNRAESSFTFSFLQSSGALVAHRLESDDFFEMHHMLGLAIAENLKAEPNQPTPQVATSSSKAGRMLGIENNLDSNESINNGTGGSNSLKGSSEHLPKAAKILGVSSSPKTTHARSPELGGLAASHQEIQEEEKDVNSKHTLSKKAAKLLGVAHKEERSSTTNSASELEIRSNPDIHKPSRNSSFAVSSTDALSYSSSPSVTGETSTKKRSFYNLRLRLSKMQISDGASGTTRSDSDLPSKSVSKRESIGGSSTTSHLELSPDRNSSTIPLVMKKYDQWNREILIKNLREGKYEITAGTVDALVDSLVEEGLPDTIFIETFLLTYRHFMTPYQLIESLKYRFSLQLVDLGSNPDPKVEQSHKIVKMRVISVIKKWVERHHYDFNNATTLCSLQEFLESFNGTEYDKYAKSIRATLDEELDKPINSRHSYIEISKTNEEKAAVIVNSFDFLDNTWTPKKIAEELTVAEINLFRVIKPEEFCFFLWGDKHDPIKTNLNAYISRFNCIGHWVATVVCSYTDLKKRVAALERFIQIMHACYKLQNFNTAVAIHSGMNMSPVSRLKRTWEVVMKGKYGAMYMDLDEKLSYKSNYKNYRETEYEAKPPIIPFFGLYIKDLTFMNDGNQKHLVRKPSVSALSNSTQPTGNIPPSLSPSKQLFGDDPTQTLFEIKKTVLSITPDSNRMDRQSVGPLELDHDLPPPLDGNFMFDAFPDAPIPPAPALINFEKCRSITNKIHALRIYQQSEFPFDTTIDPQKLPQHFKLVNGIVVADLPSISNDPNIDLTSPLALSVYIRHPYGPPHILDEKMLTTMSKDIEPPLVAGAEQPSKHERSGTLRFFSKSGLTLSRADREKIQENK